MRKLSPKKIGFYSSGNPARSLMASAILYTLLQERFGGGPPLEAVPVVDELGLDEDKIAGRVIEALSKHGVDVPPTQPRLLKDIANEIDVWIVFTREDREKLERYVGSGVENRIIELEESPKAPDTIGDFSTLLSSMRSFLEEVSPLILLAARLEHLEEVMTLIKELVASYDSLRERLKAHGLNMNLLDSSLMDEIEKLNNSLIKLSDPNGLVRKYIDSYGNLCLCGGSMRLVSEKLVKGTYELVFICSKCGKKYVRHH